MRLAFTRATGVGSALLALLGCQAGLGSGQAERGDLVVRYVTQGHAVTSMALIDAFAEGTAPPLVPRPVASALPGLTLRVIDSASGEVIHEGKVADPCLDYNPKLASTTFGFAPARCDEAMEALATLPICPSGRCVVEVETATQPNVQRFEIVAGLQERALVARSIAASSAGGSDTFSVQAARYQTCLDWAKAAGTESPTLKCATYAVQGTVQPARGLNVATPPAPPAIETRNDSPLPQFQGAPSPTYYYPGNAPMQMHHTTFAPQANAAPPNLQCYPELSTQGTSCLWCIARGAATRVISTCDFTRGLSVETTTQCPWSADARSSTASRRASTGASQEPTTESYPSRCWVSTPLTPRAPETREVSQPGQTEEPRAPQTREVAPPAEQPAPRAPETRETTPETPTTGYKDLDDSVFAEVLRSCPSHYPPELRTYIKELWRQVQRQATGVSKAVFDHMPKLQCASTDISKGAHIGVCDPERLREVAAGRYEKRYDNPHTPVGNWDRMFADIWHTFWNPTQSLFTWFRASGQLRCQELMERAVSDSCDALRGRGGVDMGALRAEPNMFQTGIMELFKDPGGNTCVVSLTDRGLFGLASPLVLDLNGDGVDTVRASTQFSLLGAAGSAAQTWVNSGDALLALDLNQNGMIDSGAELFGEGTFVHASGDTARDGYDALAQYDGNHDGIIDERDAVYPWLMLWKDDGDALSEPGELVRLADDDVASIGLAPIRNERVDASGSTLALWSAFTRRSGSSGAICDVYFRVR